MSKWVGSSSPIFEVKIVFFFELPPPRSMSFLKVVFLLGFAYNNAWKRYIIKKSPKESTNQL